MPRFRRKRRCECRLPRDPTCENGIPERPQTLRYSEIINILSLAYAQSNAERIQNRPARKGKRLLVAAAGTAALVGVAGVRGEVVDEVNGTEEELR